MLLFLVATLSWKSFAADSIFLCGCFLDAIPGVLVDWEVIQRTQVACYMGLAMRWRIERTQESVSDRLVEACPDNQGRGTGVSCPQFDSLRNWRMTRQFAQLVTACLVSRDLVLVLLQ